VIVTHAARRGTQPSDAERVRYRVLWGYVQPTGALKGGTSNGGEMLVLTRKTNESIVIGDDIEVSVLAVSRDKIRLGISAPKEIPVYRKEVWLSIQEGEAGDEALEREKS
jgi:carbon storage regulator